LATCPSSKHTYYLAKSPGLGCITIFVNSSRNAIIEFDVEFYVCSVGLLMPSHLSKRGVLPFYYVWHEALLRDAKYPSIN